jgi:hypothetical protein
MFKFAAADFGNVISCHCAGRSFKATLRRSPDP